MYIEYCNYNRYIEDYGKELTKIFKAVEEGLDGVALPIHMIREVREYFPKNVVLAAPIDFPSGYSSSKVRNHMVLNSVQSGATAIDYVPNQYLVRSNFKELASEVKTAQSICEDYGASLRIFLDYRYNSNIPALARMYHKLGVEISFPTIGYHHDDFYENILNAIEIEKKTEMSTIFNGYIWREDQIKTVLKSKIFGLRLYDLSLWCMYNKQE